MLHVVLRRSGPGWRAGKPLEAQSRQVELWTIRLDARRAEPDALRR